MKRCKWNFLSLGIISSVFYISSSNADIGQVVTDPSIKSKPTQEAATNEFPRTVGTVSRDDSGFEINWANTSNGFSNLFDSIGDAFSFNWSALDIFGFFSNKTSCDPKPTINKNNSSSAIQAKDHVTQESLTQAAAAATLQEVAELSHHVEGGVELRSADDIQKAEVELDTNKVAATDNADPEAADWRKDRQWWQRGAPVL